MKKTAKPTTATKTPATKTAKPTKLMDTMATFAGTFQFNKDTKRFHAYDIKGKGFNGALYIEKDTDPMPKTITLTVVIK